MQTREIINENRASHTNYEQKADNIIAAQRK